MNARDGIGECNLQTKFFPGPISCVQKALVAHDGFLSVIFRAKSSLLFDMVTPLAVWSVPHIS